MLGARYLLRFDDLCPTMNWNVWEEIEEVLQNYKIKPILGVIPENRDEKFMLSRPKSDFWQRVRSWQDHGWVIGLHGYQHRYQTSEAGVVGLNRRSEFAGLSLPEQRRKLTAALEVFRREKVRPDVWIAPGHSFDATTISLLHELEIKIISDGLTWWPFSDERGMVWVPQQLWKFRLRPPGLWTVCLHHNSWTQSELSAFRDQVKRFQNSITTLDEVLSSSCRRKGRAEPAVAFLMLNALRCKEAVKRCLPR